MFSDFLTTENLLLIATGLATVVVVLVTHSLIVGAPKIPR